MLKDDFYRITDKVEIDDSRQESEIKQVKKVIFTIHFNPDHPVYSGHFPGNPVVPGACQIQMIKELTSVILNREIVLSGSDNIKFLSMIRPLESPFVKLLLEISMKEQETWNVTASISKDDNIYLKFKGVMIPEER